MSDKFKKRLLPLLLLLPSVIYAQPTQPMTLHEALTLARKHSNQLQADSMQYHIAQSRVAQNKTNALPQLVANASYRRMSNNITPFVINLSPDVSFTLNPQILNQSYNSVELTQLLYSGGKVTYTSRALKSEFEASRSDYEKNILALDQQVTDLWFNLYNARASERIIQANIEVLNKKRADLETFRVEGIALANDVLKIDLSITSLRSSLADMASLAGSLNYNLCLTTGTDPATTIEIPDAYLQAVVAIAPLQVYIDDAIAKRPELKSFKFRSEAASYRIKSARSDYFPTINLIGSYNYDKPNQRVIPSENKFTYSAYAGANLTWRISAFYTNHTRVRETKLSALQLDRNILQTQDNIRMEVNTSYLEFKKTLDKMTLVQIELEQASENFRVEQNKLDAQTTTPTDFLDANVKFLQAQLNLATAKANAELAYRKLITSTGETAQ
jgi:outer membrane protein